MMPRPPLVFIIAGEESGDLLGANLMRSLKEKFGGAVRFQGVGGHRMAAEGLASLFPMEEVVLHGITEALARWPQLLARIRQTAQAVIAAAPDVLVLVDCPGFNLRVGKIVGRLDPSLPIVDYVSPSVWAYFPGRARKMARYVDQLLAILPFEPRVHRELGGPPTTYVGHPLIERLGTLRPATGERQPVATTARPVLLVLPGSRRSEIRRLMPTFGQTISLVAASAGPVEIVLPAVPRLIDEIRALAAAWPVQPAIVSGEEATYGALRRAHAALAASGTVTLELALSGVPTVVAYRLDPLLSLLKPLLKAHSIVLPNLILGRNAVPEYLDRAASPERLSAALLPLLRETPERERQLAAFSELDRIMTLEHGTPSSAATDIVVAAMRRRTDLSGNT
jgi:lipid-A-disaccharide synthase